MARWRLTEPHYLPVPGTVWEQMETDRETGRAKRREYPVPLYLNPNEPADWNYKPNGQAHITMGGNAFTEGAIIVCWAGKGEKKDIVFVGDPTPGMEPIDEEAEKVTAALRPKWHDPIKEYDAGMTPLEKQMLDLQRQIAEGLARLANAPVQNGSKGLERRL